MKLNQSVTSYSKNKIGKIGAFMRFPRSIAIVILSLILMSTAFATNSFTIVGDPDVSGYWNASNTGATVQAQSWEVGIVSFKTYISVDGAAYVQFGSISAQGGASTGQQLSFSLTASDIETTDPLSDDETFPWTINMQI